MNIKNNIEEAKNIIKESNFKHLAIIMDGNRRWAKEKFLPSAVGHQKGVESLKTIVKSCDKLGIKYLTVYAFSTENWNRSKDEVNFLMDLLAKTIKNELDELFENDVKIKFIGDIESLNDKLKEILYSAENKTKNNNGVQLQIAFNYGARDEILHATKKLAKDIQQGLIKIDDINEELFNSKLYTNSIPNPDLLIRTGGEMRISNYLLWQIAYSEIYVTQKYWPDFGEDELIEALQEFKNRNRRFGK